MLAIIVLSMLGLVLGAGLALATRVMKVESDPLADEIQAMLPGLQCGQCNFPGCRGAAEALASGEVGVTVCPPGGRSLVEKLADKLQLPADFSDFEEKPPQVALVDEQWCIGCTKCLQVCPTDAFLGAPKMMHTVISNACTGCENCIEVCPTACISMLEIAERMDLRHWRWEKPKAELVPNEAV
jgi:electron transport complex protein RnfB